MLFLRFKAKIRRCLNSQILAWLFGIFLPILAPKCQGGMGQGYRKPEMASEGSSLLTPLVEPIVEPTCPQPLAVVLLHGCGVDESFFHAYTGQGGYESLEKQICETDDSLHTAYQHCIKDGALKSHLHAQLNQACGHQFDLHIFALKDRAGFLPTLAQSIPAQAQRTVQEIQNVFAEKGLPQDCPLVLLGHSQGGVVACQVRRMQEQNAYFQLNIRGIITIGSPLEGAPILSQTHQGISRFFEKGKPGLRYLGYPTRFTRIKMCAALQGARLCCLPSVRDMDPESGFIDGLTQYLQRTPIRHLFVGGACLHFPKYEPQDEIPDWKQHPACESLNWAFARFLSKNDQPDEDSVCQGPLPEALRHDMLIPLSSQLARSISMNQNIQRVAVSGIMHAGNVFALMSNQPVAQFFGDDLQAPVQELESPEVVEHLVKFIKSL